MNFSKMQKVVDILKKNGETISFMESCTGGRICDIITNFTGASQVFKFGAVTYSNEFKIKFGVSKDKIQKFSVYSSETACEMSKKICEFSGSDYGIGITGKLNCEDLENPIGKNNIVYISLYDKAKDKFYNSCVKVNFKEREENKNVVANCVIDIMLKNIFLNLI